MVRHLYRCLKQPFNQIVLIHTQRMLGFFMGLYIVSVIFNLVQQFSSSVGQQITAIAIDDVTAMVAGAMNGLVLSALNSR